MKASVYFKNIPAGAKLILLGNFYRRHNSDWRVVAYFFTAEGKQIRRNFPIEALPALVVGATYPLTEAENGQRGYRGSVTPPKTASWSKHRYEEIPAFLKRMGDFQYEVKDLVIYKFTLGDKKYWVPAIELARVLFFCSGELVRTAFLQGNTRSLARTRTDANVGYIDLTSDVPVSYLERPEYRNFFVWLLFDQDANRSYCSIFREKNRSTLTRESYELWQFDLEPPELFLSEIYWSGFTDKTQDNIYIREIISISGLTAPLFDEVQFYHPDDMIALQNMNTQPRSTERRSEDTERPNRIDTEAVPKNAKRHQIIGSGRSGLHFDVSINTKRQRGQYFQVPSSSEDSDEPTESESSNEEVSVREGDASGSIARADFDSKKEQSFLDGREKFKMFFDMLDGLAERNGWTIERNIGEVPRANCRKLHLIKGKPRKYVRATVSSNEQRSVHFLEIELDEHESLSTPIVVLEEETSDVDFLFYGVLENLMKNSLNWNKLKLKAGVKQMCFLDHPKRDTTPQSSSVLSWIVRAEKRVRKITGQQLESC